MHRLARFYTMLVFVGCLGFLHADYAGETLLVGKDPPYARHHYEKKCSHLSHEMQEFSDQLNDANLKIFCSEFNDSQRQQAIQMASQPNMTPDQSVEMVAKNKKQ